MHSDFEQMLSKLCFRCARKNVNITNKTMRWIHLWFHYQFIRLIYTWWFRPSFLRTMSFVRMLSINSDIFYCSFRSITLSLVGDFIKQIISETTGLCVVSLMILKVPIFLPACINRKRFIHHIIVLRIPLFVVESFITVFVYQCDNCCNNLYLPHVGKHVIISLFAVTLIRAGA
mgnify:CR=1 FL=1